MKYRAEIDGLRALAVMTVLVFHFFPEFLELGYLGVDIFFVISGYLITAHLLSNPNIGYVANLKLFYTRRIKRLFPALFVFLSLTTLALSFIFLRSDMERYGNSLTATQTFWANWYFWRDGGYFGGKDQLKPLLHMWSLSIEEQFYILYPTVLLFLVGAGKKLRISPVYGIVLLSFLSFSIWLFLNSIGGQNPAFFLLPSRIWQFGVGGVIVYVQMNSKLSKVKNSPAVAFISVLIIILGFSYTYSQVINTIIVTFGAMLFIFSQVGSKIGVFRLFSNVLVVSIGRISYSLYLYHWPVAVVLLYASIETPSVINSFIAMMLSIVLGAVSYKLIERPFRYRFTFRQTLAVVIFTVVISQLSVYFVGRYSENTLESQWATASGTNFRCAPKSFIQYGASRGCLIGEIAENPPSVALLGNSHAQMYTPLIDQALLDREESGVLVPLNGCLPATTVNISLKCIRKATVNFTQIVNDESIKTVFIASTWYRDEYVNADGVGVGRDELTDAMEKLVVDFSDAGKRVALFSPLQRPKDNLASTLPRLLSFKFISVQTAVEQLKIERTIYDSEFHRVNDHFESVLGLSYIEVFSDLCDTEYCYFGIASDLYFADSNHLSRFALTRLYNSKRQIIWFLKGNGH